ncbi:hypothetical protein ACIPCA_12685 [Flavobacterium covae]|uniref:Uncharacterized protein n=1 Tax=Flavobacterium columnare TaxID=996 RepID=A0A8G0P7Q5_9FLAO|nr:hypothetical protein [Flavobacterium davisii]QYS89159.1 hypothetical protein JJC05_01665 [Flavobacterium davisii]
MTTEGKAIGLQILEKQPELKAVFLTVEGEYFTCKDWAMNGTKEKDKLEVITRSEKLGEKLPKEDESFSSEEVVPNNTNKNNQQGVFNLTEKTDEEPPKE